MVSKACVGEHCWCGDPAVKKVGEEILFDDPMPRRHNLTAYICAEHYTQLMGPMGAEQVALAVIEARSDATPKSGAARRARARIAPKHRIGDGE